MGDLLMFNTRTRKKEVFEPLAPGRVGIYTCGPTVYAPQHLGNLRSQLFADLVKTSGQPSHDLRLFGGNICRFPGVFSDVEQHVPHQFVVTLANGGEADAARDGLVALLGKKFSAKLRT